MRADFHRLVILCILAIISQGRRVTLSVQSTGYPTYLYRDEPITITCTASGYTNATAVFLVNGATVNDPRTGCALGGFNGWVKSGKLSEDLKLTNLDNAFCQTAVSQAPPFIMSLEGQVTNSLIGPELKCLARLDGTNIWSSSVFSIYDVREKIDKDVIDETLPTGNSGDEVTPSENNRDLEIVIGVGVPLVVLALIIAGLVWKKCRNPRANHQSYIDPDSRVDLHRKECGIDPKVPAGDSTDSEDSAYNVIGDIDVTWPVQSRRGSSANVGKGYVLDAVEAPSMSTTSECSGAERRCEPNRPKAKPTGVYVVDATEAAGPDLHSRNTDRHYVNNEEERRTLGQNSESVRNRGNQTHDNNCYTGNTDGEYDNNVEPMQASTQIGGMRDRENQAYDNAGLANEYS